MDILRKQQRLIEARAALGTAADIDDDNFFPTTKEEEYSSSTIRNDGGKRHRSKTMKGKKSRDSRGNTGVEKLSRECLELEWHTYHYPTCNEIHEINLGDVVRHSHHHQQQGSDTVDTFDLPWGFVSNGLWRDVFSVDPHGETVISYYNNNNNTITNYTPRRPPAVLKVMKSEHQFDIRNLERHRRDALVMERLSSSHHLVSIYGYCANTVLTQAISHTLDDVIYARENENVAKWSSRSGYVTRPPLVSWMGKDDITGELVATRETELGRIQLALGVFRGLQDLHDGVVNNGRTASSNNTTTTTTEWLPIVHADLQEKQYLVDSHTGRIYLNDFNRCRFMTKKRVSSTRSSATNNNTWGANNSGTIIESCPLFIPTAPGSARAPEEYDMAQLSEKLDIYSAGNILYGIITGNRPWDNDRGKHLKAAIQRGERPIVNDTIRYATGTVDAELTRLLDRVYEHDPLKRASAREIVNELEQLLKREMGRKIAITRESGA
jgi:serine/threonine protein kinase